MAYQNENGEMVTRDLTEIEEAELEASLLGSSKVPDIRTENIATEASDVVAD